MKIQNVKKWQKGQFVAAETRFLSGFCCEAMKQFFGLPGGLNCCPNCGEKIEWLPEIIEEKQ